MHAEALPDRSEAYVPAADWKAIDAAILRLARAKGEHDYEQGRWLLAARRAAVHARLGFSSLREYVERRLGHDGRATADRIRVAEALADLPLLAEALRSGVLAYSAIREIVRVAVPETEAVWRAACAGETVRDVERRVAGLRPGSLPDDPKDPALRTHAVRLALSPERFARYREAIERLRREVDPTLTDEDALGVMLDGVLSGTGDEGRSPSQVSYTVCRGCQRTWQQSKGEPLEVGAEAGERVLCDAQVIGDVRSPDSASGVTVVGGATPVGLDPQAGEAHPSPIATRAYQTVAPRVRREVFARDQGRCAVPGCRNHRHLDVHHLTPRAAGGGHVPSGLILLCGAHHSRLHAGLLRLEGSPEGGLRFSHADRTPYGAPPAPLGEPSEARRDAVLALVALGMDKREAEARTTQAAVEAPHAAGPDLVRAALRRRGPDRALERPTWVDRAWAWAASAVDESASLVGEAA